MTDENELRYAAEGLINARHWNSTHERALWRFRKAWTPEHALAALAVIEAARGEAYYAECGAPEVTDAINAWDNLS
jgi:hypothetical protein